MSFEKYVRGNKLSLNGGDVINILDLVKFLQKNSHIKHLTLHKAADVQNLAKTRSPNALAGLKQLGFKGKLSRYEHVVGTKTIEDSVKSLVEIGNLNEHLILAFDLSYNVLPEYIRVLANVKDLGRIDALDLSNCGLGSEDVKALAESKNLQGLKHLNLSNNKINDEGARILAESPHLSELERLNLKNNEIENIEALVQSPYMAKLKHLELGETGYLSPSLIEKLVEAKRKFDRLSTAQMSIMNNRFVIYKTEYRIFYELVIAAQSARDTNTVLDASIIKGKVFDIAARDNNGEIIKYILDQPSKYTFLVNSKDGEGHSLSHFYTHSPDMKLYLFKHGMVPQPEVMVPQPERRDSQLQNIIRDTQSVHATPAVKKTNFITAKLVESIKVDKDKLKQAADSYLADIPKLLTLYQSDQVRIGLLGITENEKRSVMKKTLRGDEPTPGDKKFIETVINEAKLTLERKYLRKGRNHYTAPLQYDYTRDDAKVTIPESIGYVTLLINRHSVTLAEKKELLVTLAAQNPVLVKGKLPLIRSEFKDFGISLKQVTDRTRFYQLLQSIDGDKIDNLFEQISDLNIKEVWREQKEFILIKQIYVAATTYGEGSSSCIQGTWTQIINSVDEIDHELIEQFNQHLERIRQEIGIDEQKGKKVAESLAKKLIEYVKTQPNFKDALERLSTGMINIINPEGITLKQQTLLAKINGKFVQGISDGTIKRHLGSDYDRSIPKNDEYQMIINGFFDNEEINTFIQLDRLEEISKRIKNYDEQGQIAQNQNREILEKEVKMLMEDFTENGIDINTQNSKGETLLHLAARIGDKSLVSDLLARGAVFNVQNKGNLTPKDLSKPGEVLTLLKNVEQAFRLVNDYQRVTLEGLRSAIENLGDAQTIVKAKNGDGHILLSLIVSKKPSELEHQQKKQLNVINLLIKNGADIDFKDAQGNSLLYTAVSNADKEVVDVLLERGVVIDDATEAIPHANKNIKTILKKLKQHKLKISRCEQSGRRVRREAVHCVLRANEYIDTLRELPMQEQIMFTQGNEIDFIGSTHEIKQAEKVRDLLLSDTSIVQKSYEINKLLEDPRERRVLDLSEDMSQSINPKLKQRLMNAAGRIQLFRGMHATFTSCENGELSADCMLGVGEIGYAFLSQPIENSVLKITPRVVNSAAKVAGNAPGILGKNLRFAIQLNGMKFGKQVARGVAGAIGGVFDIVDIGMSADTLIRCANRREKGEQPCADKEIRDSIAAISFAGASFTSGIALTAAAMPGVGTLVGLGIMAGQGIYGGVSNVIEYKEKYKTTRNENWRIFWHTIAFQPIPANVQSLKDRTEFSNQFAKQAWEHLENSADNVVAIAMGLGDVAFNHKTVGRTITNHGFRVSSSTEIIDGKGCTWYQQGSIFSKETCSNITVQVPDISPSHASIMMNETNADTTKLSRFVPQSPSPNAKMLGLPKWSDHVSEYKEERKFRTVLTSGKIQSYHEKVPYYSENSEAIYPCDNAFVIADRIRMANYNQTVIFDLSYVNEGKIVGSNEGKNVFLIHGGREKIFGGDNTINNFIVMDKEFSGTIHGGLGSNNILNLSNLSYSWLGVEENVNRDEIVVEFTSDNTYRGLFLKEINNIISVQSLQERIRCPNDEIFVNSGGGESNDKKDLLINCKKAVIWPYTNLIGSDGNYIFYIKPNRIHEDIGHSKIDIRGNGTLIFPETALLKDCGRITYFSSSNTLSIEIPLDQGKTFILEVKNYLNEDKAPKFHLIDKHGSNIIPVIRESGEVKFFHLHAKRTFTNSKEDEDWYRSISQSHEDYQVFSVIKDKQFETSYRIFGSSGVDVIDLDEKVIFARGGNGSDVYHLDNNISKLIAIDNCAEDRELDALWTQQNYVAASKSKSGNSLLLHFQGELGNYGIMIKNYFKDLSCQHLIIQKDEDMLIPFNSEGTISLVPFYHASNSENVFFLPENSTEIVINAHKEGTKFYKYKDDFVLIRDKDDDTTIPLTVVARGFYSDPSKWQGVKPYFWSKGEFSAFNLSQKAAEAVDYTDKVKSNYEEAVKEYKYSDTFSGEITHNQQELENGTLATIAEDKQRIGVLVLKDIDPSRIGLSYSDTNLIFFDTHVDHKNLTIRNWNASEDHRISRMEFDLESGPIVIRKLDRFDLSREGRTRIQNLLSNAALNVEGSGLHNETYSKVKNITISENSTEAHTKLTVHNRLRRNVKMLKMEASSQINEKSVPNSASRSKSLIIDTIVAVANIALGVFKLIPSLFRPALPSNNLHKEDFHDDNEQRNPSSKFREQFSIETCGRNNINAFYFLLQNFLDAKYPLPKWQSIGEKEVLVNALNITERFEQILSTTCNTPAEELIDLAEVQSDVFKAMMSDNSGKIPKILHSYASTILAPEGAKDLLAAFQDIVATQDNNPTTSLSNVSLSEDQTKHLPYLPGIKPQTCLNNVKVDNSNISLLKVVI